MEILYYRTVSGREPVREYISSLPEVDRVAIAGDMEVL